MIRLIFCDPKWIQLISLAERLVIILESSGIVKRGLIEVLYSLNKIELTENVDLV